MKALRTFADTRERRPELESTLRTVMNSLKAMASPKRLFSKLHAEDQYGHFEQIRTLQEVSSGLDRPQLLNRLEAIVNGDSAESEDIRAVSRFFASVEDRALYHYNDPVLSETSS
jgi:hypothetical protein